MITGDLCADTRPAPVQFNCTDDPPGTDCDGNPWFDTPVSILVFFPLISGVFFPLQIWPKNLYNSYSPLLHK